MFFNIKKNIFFSISFYSKIIFYYYKMDIFSPLHDNTHALHFQYCCSISYINEEEHIYSAFFKPFLFTIGGTKKIKKQGQKVVHKKVS